MTDMEEEGEDISKNEPKDIFRRLVQLMPNAYLEDYYKMGSWKTDVMVCDIELLEAHRREAGAPDPVPIEEVPEPDVPAGPKFLGGASGPTGARPLGGATGLLGRPQGVQQPTLRPLLGSLRPTPRALLGSALGPRPFGAAGPKAPAPKATGPKQPSGAPPPSVLAQAGRGPGPAPKAAGSQLDMRRLVPFVSKWKLEPNRTKALLGQLSASQQIWVIDHFRYVPGGGMTPTSKLEEFIRTSEKTTAFRGASGGTAPAAFPAKALAGGVKRNWVQTNGPAASQGAPKFPKVGFAGARPLAARPPGTLRPVVVGGARPHARPQGLSMSGKGVGKGGKW